MGDMEHVSEAVREWYAALSPEAQAMFDAALIAADEASRASNVLEGMACPKCGANWGFKIMVTVRGTATITDDGFAYEDIEDADTTWEDDDPCRCVPCGHEGTVADFTVPTQALGG